MDRYTHCERLRLRFLTSMGLPLAIVACERPQSNGPREVIMEYPPTGPSTDASSAARAADAAAPAIASTASIAEPPAKRSAGPRTWQHGQQEVCIRSSDTQGAASAAKPFESCRDPTPVIWDGPLPCGPCAWSFNDAATSIERKKRADSCCYTGTSPSGPGRMLRIDGVITTAPATSSVAWSKAGMEGVLESAELAPGERARLASAWVHDAALEHASVGAFSLAALRLLALGAPKDIIVGCHLAALDEIEHAAACYAVASAYAGKSIGPGCLDVRGSDVVVTIDALAVETFVDGCIGETAAAVDARRRAESADNTVIASVLGRIADDEERHAALAWRTLAWTLETGGPLVARAIEQARDEMVRDLAVSNGSAAIRREVMTAIVLPCVDDLLRVGAGVESPRCLTSPDLTCTCR